MFLKLHVEVEVMSTAPQLYMIELIPRKGTTYFFRKEMPFLIGMRAESSPPPPPPTTISGMLRTMLREEGINVSTTGYEPGEFGIIGPYLAKRDDDGLRVYYPAPADSCIKSLERKSRIKVLSESLRRFACSIESDMPVGLTIREDERPDGDLVSFTDFWKYLVNGDIIERFTEIEGNVGVFVEEPGIKMLRSRKVVEIYPEGGTFHVRKTFQFYDGWELVAFVLPKRDNVKSALSELANGEKRIVRVGGEGRFMDLKVVDLNKAENRRRIKAVETALLDDNMRKKLKENLEKSADGNKLVKIVLLTPAIFVHATPAGYLTSYYPSGDLLNAVGLRAKIIAAVVKRKIVSGFYLEGGTVKSTVMGVSPGSVFFLKPTNAIPPPDICLSSLLSNPHQPTLPNPNQQSNILGSWVMGVL